MMRDAAGAVRRGGRLPSRRRRRQLHTSSGFSTPADDRADACSGTDGRDVRVDLLFADVFADPSTHDRADACSGTDGRDVRADLLFADVFADPSTHDF
jgi:hypothetical protein